ncbi:zinc ribbon domain-containing protein [Halobellus captivus]|uniref:zinc ribbon domain-containing protein n=1 Tax=Halobellus captivus TaxID=2592614 RepID=UPI0011A17FCC|nr:zinc ribbon domain-containing protein [Halobellus captivus]
MDQTRGKRPWLAALLGTFATGLGHVYLRRWQRGLGWFVAAVAVSYFLVPPEAAEALLAGEPGDPRALAPVFAVSIASIADAYVLARRTQQRARQSTVSQRPGSTGSDGMGATRSGSVIDDGSDVDTDRRDVTDERRATGSTSIGKAGISAGSAEDCPNCGKELDPELDFCPWCTTRLNTEN